MDLEYLANHVKMTSSQPKKMVMNARPHWISSLQDPCSKLHLFFLRVPRTVWSTVKTQHSEDFYYLNSRTYIQDVFSADWPLHCQGDRFRIPRQRIHTIRASGSCIRLVYGAPWIVDSETGSRWLRAFSSAEWSQCLRKAGPWGAGALQVWIWILE